MQNNNSETHSENMSEPKTLYPPPLRSAETAPASHRSADRIPTTDYSDRASTVKMLYVIIDSVTNSPMGGIQIHLNDASALRTLYDIATGDTLVNKHPEDFDLYRLGALGSDRHIYPETVRILTGLQIAAIVKASKEP